MRQPTSCANLQREAAALGDSGWYLLQDLSIHGAISGGVPETRLTRPAVLALAKLIREGLVVSVPTCFGPAYVLSAHAKRLLNVHSTWVTRPEMAAQQLLLRQTGQVLHRHGWQRQLPGRLPYPKYQRMDGRIAYVLVNLHSSTSRRVRRILTKYRAQLLREGAVLLVFSRHWKRLRHLVDWGNGLLEVAPLNLLLAGPGRPSPGSLTRGGEVADHIPIDPWLDDVRREMRQDDDAVGKRTANDL